MAARKRATKKTRVTGAGVLGEATAARVVIEVDLVKVYGALRKWFDKLPPERKEELARYISKLADEVPSGVYGGVQVNTRPTRVKRAKKGTR